MSWLGIPLAIGRGLYHGGRCLAGVHGWQLRRRPFYRDGSPLPVWYLRYQACAWCGVARRFRIEPYTPAVPGKSSENSKSSERSEGAQARDTEGAAIARSVRRHYRKLLRRAAHLMGPCPHCRGHGADFAGDDCWRCGGTGKVETPAWGAFLLLRGAPRWLVNGEASPPEGAPVRSGAGARRPGGEG